MATELLHITPLTHYQSSGTIYMAIRLLKESTVKVKVRNTHTLTVQNHIMLSQEYISHNSSMDSCRMYSISFTQYRLRHRELTIATESVIVHHPQFSSRACTMSYDNTPTQKLCTCISLHIQPQMHELFAQDVFCPQISGMDITSS